MHVSSEGATSHLIKARKPVTPPAADMARIQGNVILVVTIDERGKPSEVQLLRGHPMLVDAAVDAVKQWQYRPFEVNGSPAPVIANVMVTFGRPADDRHDRELMQLEDYLGFAREAAAKSDYALADTEFTLAKQLVASVGGDSDFFHWKINMAIADVRVEQKKYEEAEQNYKEASKIYANANYPSPNESETLGKLADLYLQQKRYPEARENLVNSISILETICNRRGGCYDSEGQQRARRLVYEYVDLSRIAALENNAADAANWCKKVHHHKKMLDPADRDCIVAACEETIRAAAGK